MVSVGQTPSKSLSSILEWKPYREGKGTVDCAMSIAEEAIGKTVPANPSYHHANQKLADNFWSEQSIGVSSNSCNFGAIKDVRIKTSILKDSRFDNIVEVNRKRWLDKRRRCHPVVESRTCAVFVRMGTAPV